MTDSPNRLFFGLAIPDSTREKISVALSSFDKNSITLRPEAGWHLTLLFLGECPDVKGYLSRMTKPIPQAYVPTVVVTHLGKGLVGHHLWAYAQTPPSLEAVREELFMRLKKMRFAAPGLKEKKPFVPHIHVADLAANHKTEMLPDKPIKSTFAVKEICLFQANKADKEHPYTIVATIPLAR